MAYILLEDLFRFIDADELKVYCGFSKNVNVNSILPSIQLAQNLKLKNILGETLYDKLKDEFLLANKNPNYIRDSSQSPDGIDYKELYFKCFPVLVWWSAYYAITDIPLKIEEKGLVFETADYAENGQFEAMSFKEGRFKTIAEQFTEELICYLNITFPKNSTQDNLVEYQDKGKEEGVYTTTIFFKKNFNKKCKNC